MKLSPLIPFLLYFGIILPFSTASTQDWSLLCPKGCNCKWSDGKRFAKCSGFKSIPSGLSPELQFLEMHEGSNSIRSLPPDAFASTELVNLHRLHLSNVGIERADPASLRNLSIMIELDLSRNLLTSIHMEMFEWNVKLRELKLSRNPQLSQLLGESFPYLQYLKQLDLSYCALSSIPKTAFERLTVLNILRLEGNRFSYLSVEVVAPLAGRLVQLDLKYNPWRCDCRLKALRDWVIGEPKLKSNLPSCAEPPHLSNYGWAALISPDFACRPEILSVQINGKTTDAYLVHTDVGNDIELQCLVRGSPPPDLKWVRDGQVLTNSSRSYGKSYYLHIGVDGGAAGEVDNEYKGRWVNLTIQKTDPEDAGEYTCVGSSAGGVVEKNLTLNFQDVPSGAGVGHGLGGGGVGGAYRDGGLIWIIATIVPLLVFTGVIVTLACFCSRRRRLKPRGGGGGGVGDGGKNEAMAKLNGSSGGGYSECPANAKSLEDSSSPTASTSSLMRHTIGAHSSTEVELTYRINPLHSTTTNTPLLPPSINTTLRRQQQRCTMEGNNKASAFPTYYPAAPRTSGSHPVDPSGSTSSPYFHPYTTFSTGGGGGEVLLPPPPQYAAPAPAVPCCSVNAAAQFDEWMRNENDIARFESDNLVVSHVPAPAAVAQSQSIIPVHSFSGSDYGTTNRGLRLPDKVPPPPPQRDSNKGGALSPCYERKQEQQLGLGLHQVSLRSEENKETQTGGGGCS